MIFFPLDLYKNEKTRQKTISKLEDSGGFQPKSFKSSRSDRKRDEPSKFRSELAHENAIFGTSSQSLTQSSNALINPSMISASNKTIMSDLVNNNLILINVLELILIFLKFFEDVKARQNRWKLRMIELLNAK